MVTDTITLGVQAGDEASAKVTHPSFMALRKLLASHCKGPYSDQINEFAIVLRIAGDIWNFEGAGCQKLKLSRKGHYVSIDIVMPKNEWSGVSTDHIKNYLARSVENAVSLMIEKLETSKIKIEATRLTSDLRRAISEFLTQ